MKQRKSRLPALPAKRDAFTAILRYLEKEDVVLTNDETLILNRWMVVELLIRKKEKTEEEIVAYVCENFHVSIYTAKNDIYYAQELMVRWRKLVKKYLYRQHLERLDMQIEMLSKKFFTATIDEKTGESKFYVPDAKEIAALGKLQEVYTYTLNSIPEEVQKHVQPPPIFQFLLPPKQVIEKPMNITDAMAAADEIIMKENQNGVFEADDLKE